MPARAWNSVCVKPGQSAVAVTPVPASSLASPSVNTVTKAFSAEYVPLAMKPATDETLRMAPCPRARMARPAAWLVSMTARTMTSRPASSAARSLSRKDPLSPNPALLTSRSIGPHVVLEARAHPAGRLAVGQVGDQHLDGHAVTHPQPGGELVEPGPVAGHEHEVGALPGEAFGEGAADAGGGAGDECSAHGGGTVCRQPATG